MKFDFNIAYFLIAVFMIAQILGNHYQDAEISRLKSQVRRCEETQEWQGDRIEDLEYQNSELYKQMVDLQNKVDDLPK